MDLIAGKNCQYRGKKVPHGTRFSAPRQFARALIGLKMARPAPETAPATYSHRAITQTRRVDMHALDHDGDGRKGGSIAPEKTDDLKELRARYTEVMGKRPFNGWTADQLRAKMG